MSVLKSRFFWLNLLAICVLIIQYFINNQMFPSYIGWEGLALVVLNAIAGMLQSNTVTLLKNVYPDWKASVTGYKNKMNQRK